MLGTAPIRPLSFDEILDDIVEEARSVSSTARHTPTAEPRMKWFSHLLDMAVAPETSAIGSRREAYGDDIAEISTALDDEDTVAAELALSRVASLAELKQVRRDFALRNHPDRMHPAVQGWATRRMTIANMLIDRRGKELARARQ
jgi:hypothetical protein